MKMRQFQYVYALERTEPQFDYGNLIQVHTGTGERTNIGFWHLEDSVMMIKVSTNVRMTPITPNYVLHHLSLKVSAVCTERA